MMKSLNFEIHYKSPFFILSVNTGTIKKSDNIAEKKKN